MKTKPKKTVAAKKQANHAVVNNVNTAYFLKEKELQQLPPEFRSLLLQERKFKSAAEIEQLVVQNSKALFGEQAILIREEKGAAKGQPVPAIFLVDFNEVTKPRLFVINICMDASFYDSLFPRLTGYFSRLSGENVNGLWEWMGGNEKAGKALRDIISAENVPDFVQSLLWNKPVILLISNTDIPELSAIKQTYSEWQRVKQIIITKYLSNGNSICSVSPDFSAFQVQEKEKRSKKESVPVSEEEHLKDVSEEIREVYTTIKTELLKVNNQLVFNSQKYYISIRKQRNVAVFHFSRKRITLVVLRSEAETREKIKYHEIKTLTPKVMQFWGGPSCSIVIEGTKHLNEVIALLKKLVTE